MFKEKLKTDVFICSYCTDPEDRAVRSDSLGEAGSWEF